MSSVTICEDQLQGMVFRDDDQLGGQHMRVVKHGSTHGIEQHKSR